jgi:hypothetical protein
MNSDGNSLKVIPSPCPLPAARGEGGRRPGEGFVFSFWNRRAFQIIKKMCSA